VKFEINWFLKIILIQEDRAMKKMKALALAGLLSAFLLPQVSFAGARIYVRIGPPPPKRVTVVKVHKPHKHAVWVAGHWQWNGKKYVWVNGHWVKPRNGYVYVPGHWQHNRHGWYWVSGHWKRI